MGQNKRKRYERFWGILGALWLLIGCLTGLAGCGQKQQPADTLQAKEEVVQERAGVSDTIKGETTIAQETSTLAETAPALETTAETSGSEPENVEETALVVEETGLYTGKDEVALYIHTYGHLPDNYITKREAENLGWNSKEGNLWQVAPGMSIGGSRFGNYEGALPDKEGRQYYECDIDYDGGYRGAKRIIYSDDGLIFYTEDHYKTFEQLYGE